MSQSNPRPRRQPVRTQKPRHTKETPAAPQPARGAKNFARGKGRVGSVDDQQYPIKKIGTGS